LPYLLLYMEVRRLVHIAIDLVPDKSVENFKFILHPIPLQVHIVQLLYLLASSSYSNVIIYTTYNSGFSKKKVLLYTLQLIERAN